MDNIYVLLGGNIGDVLNTFNEAKNHLREVAQIVQESSVYSTKAWGNQNQGDFLNQVIKINSLLNPENLMERLLEIESKLGRTRNIKNDPRTIDLDLLFYGSQILNTDFLSIPHPKIQERRFALVPLNEIAPNYIHPKLKLSISQILMECKDPLGVILFL